MIDRVDIVVIEVDLEYRPTDSCHRPRTREMELDTRVRIESTDNIGPCLARLEWCNQLDTRVVIRHSHPLYSESRIRTQTSRRVIRPIHNCLWVSSRDDDISLLYLIGLRCHHIYSNISSSDGGISSLDQ
jgi:hypothetical protein